MNDDTNQFLPMFHSDFINRVFVKTNLSSLQLFLPPFQSKGADRKLKVEMQKLEHKTKEELVRQPNTLASVFVGFRFHNTSS